MKDDFNFEQVLGSLAQCVANRNYHGVKSPLKKLIAHAQTPEIITTLTDTIDYLSEKAGAPFIVYLLDELLGDLKNPKTIEAHYLQGKLVEKWGQVLDEGIAAQPDSMLSYLTGACRVKDDAHPLNAVILPRWTALVESMWPLQGFDLECTLAIDGDIKNAEFRKAALTKLASLKDTDSDIVMKMMEKAIDSSFYSFKDKDPESARILIGAMADILEKAKGSLKRDRITEVAWKIFARGEGLDASAEKKAARCFLDAAAQETDSDKAFNHYRGLMRYNKAAAEEAREAAGRLLDLVDAGKMKNFQNGYGDVCRCVEEEVFERVTKGDAKDDDLAARAAATLLTLVREELSKPDTHRSYMHYNCAVMLVEYFDPKDPRAAEVKKLWQDGLTREFKPNNDDYYARQMGWMLDAATKKGDTAYADFARKEWRDSIEATAKKFPRDAHKTVKDIVVNAVHYGPQSALLAEAKALLPDLEERAGIKKTPETMGSDDFLKMIGKKNGTGFKP